MIKLQGLLPTILDERNDPEIEWISKSNTTVFKLTGIPDFVFKAQSVRSNNSPMISRFRNMEKGREICAQYGLNLLVIPAALMLTMHRNKIDYDFIVEESLPIEPNASFNEEFYHQYSQTFNETARQLAIFVAESGFFDVDWRNLPALPPNRIALIDLEDMGNRRGGFLGHHNNSIGLLNCVSADQFDDVLAEGRRHGLELTEEEAKQAREWRMQQIESDRQLRAFHQTKRIVSGKEPIKVDDLDTLGLDLDREGRVWGMPRAITLREGVTHLIAEINKLIQAKSDRSSAKHKRYLCLNHNDEPFMDYSRLRFEGEPDGRDGIDRTSWLLKTIQTLVDKGHLFKLERIDGHGYFIQA